jgi:hypothetical protein
LAWRARWIVTREGGETKLSLGTSTLFDRYQYYTASHSEARASLAFGCLHTDVGVIGLSAPCSLPCRIADPQLYANLSITGSVDGMIPPTRRSDSGFKKLVLSGQYNRVLVMNGWRA